MSETPASSLTDRFTALARRFEVLADEQARAEAAVEEQRPTPDCPYTEVDPHSTLLEDKRRQDYRTLVRAGGHLALALHEQAVVQIEGLPELIAARDTKAMGELVVDTANLFALLVGGPAIELNDGEGRVMGQYEKPNAGWPPHFRKAPGWDAIEMACRWFDGPPPSPEQCRRYARACRQLARAANPDDAAAKVPERARRAYAQYSHAAEAFADEPPTDDAAYDLLKGSYEDRPELEQELGSLPARESWKRYLREFRSATDQQKHRPREGQAAQARSVVHLSDL